MGLRVRLSREAESNYAVNMQHAHPQQPSNNIKDLSLRYLIIA